MEDIELLIKEFLRTSIKALNKYVGASIDHAEYMADEFNKRGIPSVCLTGKNTAFEREQYIKKLESDTDELKVIFWIYNSN